LIPDYRSPTFHNDILALSAEMNTQFNILGVIVIATFIDGCATKPVEVANNASLNPTAVIELQAFNSGINGFFPYEENERHYVRSNMRRDELSFNETGTFSRLLAIKRSETRITRIDLKLLWLVNPAKEEYTECPIDGCAEHPPQSPAKPDEAHAEHPKTKHEPGCSMNIVHTSFTVKATGNKKSINGYETDEYQVAWSVNLSDKSSRKSISTLNMEIWTTPLTQVMRDTLGMADEYSRALSGTFSGTSKPQIIPEDAAKLISSYLGDALSPRDISAFLDANKQMERVRGYPISTHLSWSMKGDACAPKESSKSKDETYGKKALSTGTGSPVSSFAGMSGKNKTDGVEKDPSEEPILTFTLEVKSLKIQPLQDAIFTVPKNYRLAPHP
jgi:hypothetical protein